MLIIVIARVLITIIAIVDLKKNNLMFGNHVTLSTMVITMMDILLNNTLLMIIAIVVSNGQLSNKGKW